MHTPHQNNQELQANKTSFKVSETGQINFETTTKLTPEILEVIQRLQDQSDYRHAKNTQLIEREQDAKQKMDTATMTFVGCILLILMFAVSQVISFVGNSLKPQPSPSYVIHTN